jgi:cytochrome c biogenesis protein CcmG/thiol:disulfide interchange protein DsbE
MRRITLLLTFLATMSMASVGAFAAAEIGQPAPALVVPELGGQTFNLTAERGSVVIINFWATWCPPCRDEMPALDAFYRRYHDEGLVMLGLSADRPHDRSDVAKAMESFSYPAAMMRDAKTNGFGSPATVPTTLVVDRDGILRVRMTADEDKVTEDSLAKAVMPWLSPKPPPTGANGSSGATAP